MSITSLSQFICFFTEYWSMDLMLYWSTCVKMKMGKFHSVLHQWSCWVKSWRYLIAWNCMLQLKKHFLFYFIHECLSCSLLIMLAMILWNFLFLHVVCLLCCLPNSRDAAWCCAFSAIKNPCVLFHPCSSVLHQWQHSSTCARLPWSSKLSGIV